MNKTKRAFELANMRHDGQKRADGSPYFQHPLRVMANIMQFKVSEHLDELMAAALLHDSLEDTYTSFRELEEMFGPMVASIVMECTSSKDTISRMGKTEYLKEKMYSMSSYALTVKLADRLDNVQDLLKFDYTQAKNKVKETEAILDHVLKRKDLVHQDGTLTTNANLCKEIRNKLDEWGRLK